MILTATRATSALVPRLVWGLVILLGAVACTGETEPPRSAPSSETPTTRAATEPASAPFRVRVTRVSGTLGPKDRSALARNVGRVLSAYVDAAFLHTRPRADTADALATFTPRAARSARRDLALLTNKRLEPSTQSVRAVRRTAYLSVLAPYRVAAGVTAKVDLEMLVKRSAAPPERLRLKGRLLLTRDRDGGWRIFGYDLSRSDTPVRNGS